MVVVPALLNYRLVLKKLRKSYGGKKSLINLGRMWSSLGSRIWKHRFSKLGQLGSALESRHSGFLDPGEVGSPGSGGAHSSSGVYKAFCSWWVSNTLHTVTYHVHFFRKQMLGNISGGTPAS